MRSDLGVMEAIGHAEVTGRVAQQNYVFSAPHLQAVRPQYSCLKASV